MTVKQALVVAANIESKILLIRGQKVMLDADLAELYGVETKRLNEQVRRNAERFPADFMFQLTAEEKAEVVANCDHLAKLKYSPYSVSILKQQQLSCRVRSTHQPNDDGAWNAPYNIALFNLEMDQGWFYLRANKKGGHLAAFLFKAMKLNH